jgi:hypothetical protein
MSAATNDAATDAIPTNETTDRIRRPRSRDDAIRAESRVGSASK